MPVADLSSARLVRIAAALLALVLAGGDVLAQRPQYRERPAPYERDGPSGRERRDTAGVFDYYVLALSWSPTYCADVGDARRDPQCSLRPARPYAFVLHGLWPQFERGWPRNCQFPGGDYVPGPVADRMLDIMPSRRLVFHEYRTHGTCSGLGVDGYFDLARRLYEKIRIPRRFVGHIEERMTISPDDLVAEFVSANPRLEPDMLVVQCGGPGNRLKEVRICFDKAGRFRACGRNEDQSRLCSADRMYVPPVRGVAGASPERRSPAARDILPGPGERRL